MSNWYYAKGEQQQGPVTEAELKRLAETGQVRPTDLVWSDGMESWIEAGKVPEIFRGGPTAGGPTYHPSSPPPQQPYQQQPIGYATPQSYQQPIGYAPSPPPNYLAQAIIVTILCCWPLGIPAIVFAAQVNGKWMSGDYRGAIDASNKARTWSWVAFFGAMAPAIVMFVFFCAGVAAEM